MGLSQRRVQFQRVLVALHRLWQPVRVTIRDAQKVIKRRIVHSEFSRLGEMLYRFGVVLLLEIEQSQIAPQRRKTPLNRDSLFVVRNGGIFVRFRLDETQLIPGPIVCRILLSARFVTTVRLRRSFPKYIRTRESPVMAWSKFGFNCRHF